MTPPRTPAEIFLFLHNSTSAAAPKDKQNSETESHKATTGLDLIITEKENFVYFSKQNW